MAPPRVGAGSTATAVQVRKDEPTRPVFGTTPQQKAHTPWTAKNGPRKIGSPPPPTEQPPEEKSTSQGLVQQHPTATKPVVTSTWWSTLNAAADRLGASLQSAGKTIASASAGLGAASWLGLEARALGAATELLGKGVANAPEGAVVASDAIHGAATDLYARGEKLVAESQRLGRHGVQLATDGVQGLENGVAAIGTAAREYASIISKATDYRTNIDKLGEGDSYTLGLDGWAGIEGVRALANGNIEVSRNASGYTVSEEAQRAASILLKQAGTLAAGALVPLPGSTLAAQAIAGPSREDLEFLGKNISAVEFSGNACAEVFGILGVKNAAGLLGVANVTAQQAVRIEPPPQTARRSSSHARSCRARWRATRACSPKGRRATAG